jgi:hypothetical protein
MAQKRNALSWICREYAKGYKVKNGRTSHGHMLSLGQRDRAPGAATVIGFAINEPSSVQAVQSPRSPISVKTATLTLPSTKGTVTVTAQDQFAPGGTSMRFAEAAN